MPGGFRGGKARTWNKNSIGKGLCKMKAMRCLSTLFLLWTGLIFFLPLSRAEHLPAKPLVVIDPAHGGSDKGVKLSDSENEKDIALKIALLLEKELQIRGNVRVQLTRTSDRHMPVAERIKAVRDSGARMFISLHINAGFGKKAAGYEVYFPGFRDLPANKDGAAAIVKDMAANKYLNDSVALAQVILRNLQNVFPRKGRGLRNAPAPVLEGLNLPAVVVEAGFASNPDEKKTITGDSGQRAIAQALSRSIEEFFH
jgi:N-acetylmuramoyl-L-alanine amidase